MKNKAKINKPLPSSSTKSFVLVEKKSTTKVPLIKNNDDLSFKKPIDENNNDIVLFLEKKQRRYNLLLCDVINLKNAFRSIILAKLSKNTAVKEVKIEEKSVNLVAI